MGTKKFDPRGNEHGPEHGSIPPFARELDEPLRHHLADDLEIENLKRRKLKVKEQIEELKRKDPHSDISDDMRKPAADLAVAQAAARAESLMRSMAEEDEGSEADWREIKAEVLKLLRADLLDTPASHLAYIRERIGPVIDHAVES